MALLHTGFGRRIEAQLQTEAAECGLACLAMIASSHGHETDLREMRQRFAGSLLGVTLNQMIRDARSMGFCARALRLEPGEFGGVRLPCIAHMDMNHFVVLQGRSRKGFDILDPAVGARQLSPDEFARRFTGVALELLPTPALQRRRRARQDTSVIALLGRPEGLGGALLRILLLALAIEVFALSGPFLTQWAIDEALVGADTQLLLTIVVGLAVVGVLQTATETVRGMALMHLNASLGLQWFGQVCARLFQLPLSYFQKRHLGGITARVDTVTTIQTTITHGLVESLVDGLMALATLLMMVLYNARLASVSVSLLVVYTGLRLGFFQAVRRHSERQFVFGAHLQTYLIESLQGMQAIKLFGQEAARVGTILNKSVMQRNAGLGLARLGLLFHGANALLFRMEAVVVLALAGLAVIDKTFTVGMFIAYTTLREQFARRVSALVDKLIEYRMLSVQTERLADILLEKADKSSHHHPIARVGDAPAALVARNLCFAYAPSLAEVVKELSFNIQAGEHVCFIGPSGCGKSTLLKLMTGLFEPTSGQITYAGVAIQSLGEEYRALCATVTQDDVLFAGSIAENIAFFDEFPDHLRIRQCAETACVDQEIRRFPMGYETRIGDMGTALSGGQKQRILLARALYKRPRILFLDEATSHLDATRERQILANLNRMSITRIVIAHRRESIEAADRVIDLGKPSDDRDRTPGISSPLETTDETALQREPHLHL